MLELSGIYIQCVIFCPALEKIAGLQEWRDCDDKSTIWPGRKQPFLL